jgi:hypothetical protein
VQIAHAPRARKLGRHVCRNNAIMDKLERLAYWKTVAADASRAVDPEFAAKLESDVWKNEDDLFGFFCLFQPDGKGVERAFIGVVGGDEILQRLLKVYEYTQENSELYFIVRRPIPATPERLIDVTVQYLEKNRQIARAFGDAALVRLLEVLPEIRIKREGIPQRFATEFTSMPEAIVCDAICDWLRELAPIPSHALLMKEAFYSIACDYCIAHHFMWPLYRHSTDIEEPFAAYFELWTHGAQPWFEKPGLVNVYVTGDC